MKQNILLLLFIIFYFTTNVLSQDFFINQNKEVITLTNSNFVVIRGQITGKLASKVIIDLIEMRDKVIYLYISSPGGSVVDGMKIIQVIKGLELSGKKIICIADMALSMGFAILQYCSERVVMQSSILMQHQMSLQLGGSINNVNSYVSFIHSMNDEVDKKQSEKLGI